MKTRISKISFLLTGLSLMVIMSLFFFSCQKDEVIPANEPFDYEQIGIEHNKGLDYVFEYLKEKGVGKKSGLKSVINTPQLVDNATTAFLEKEADFDKASRTNAVSNFMTKKIQSGLKSAQVNSKKDLESKLLYKSSKVKFEEITQVLNNIGKVGIDKSIKKLEKIQNEIQLECVQEELPVLMSVCVTARYSLDYWGKNLEKWMIEFGGVESLMLKNAKLKSGSTEHDWDWFTDTLGDMATADAIGAGAGAVVGLAGFVFGPAGFITVPATAVGYGLNASAMKGLWELFH